jgi:pimeloyl-ACP methyl ester carboxylesterase
LGWSAQTTFLTLGEIKCPTLVIWSRQDELWSLQEAKELVKGVPNAKLEIIED